MEISDLPDDTKPALVLMRDRLADFIAWADERGDTILAIRLAEAHAMVADQVGSNDD